MNNVQSLESYKLQGKCSECGNVISEKVLTNIEFSSMGEKFLRHPLAEELYHVGDNVLIAYVICDDCFTPDQW